MGRSEAPDSSEGLKGPDSGDRIAQALKTSFKDLDSQILAEEQKQGVEKGAFGGCTAVVALVMGDVSLLLMTPSISAAMHDSCDGTFTLSAFHKYSVELTCALVGQCYVEAPDYIIIAMQCVQVWNQRMLVTGNCYRNGRDRGLLQKWALRMPNHMRW